MAQGGGKSVTCDCRGVVRQKGEGDLLWRVSHCFGGTNKR